MKNLEYKNLSTAQKLLLQEASKAKERAYNPYSHFFVGAALLTDSGTIIVGANVENAAYSPCICAERSAIVSANASGHQKFTKIAVIARPEKGVTQKATAPCGVCRQMIFEAAQVSGVDIEVIMSNTEMTEIIVATIKELLPLAFGPDDLG